MALITRLVTNAGAPLSAPDGALLENTKIIFVLVNKVGAPADAWDAATNERVGGDPIIVTTDAKGEFSVELWPNSRGDRLTRYHCTVQHPGFRAFYGVVEDVPGPLTWAAFMLSGGEMTAQDMSAISAAIAGHVATPDPHPQYAKESDLGAAAGLDVGTAAGTVAAGNDPRLSDPRTPTGGAGGVLSGSYPNPGFAVDMATQAELDLVSSAKVDKVAGKGLSTEDYSTAEKSKLAGVDAGANNYSHPANHPPSIITQDASNRFVTDAEKTAWNAKEPTISAGTTAQYWRGDKTWRDFFTDVRAATLTGLSTATNAVIAAADTVLSALGKLQKQVSDNLTTLTSHTGNTSNPHGVTKAQVGLGNVDNTSDANKPVSTAQAAADALRVLKAGDIMAGALTLASEAIPLTVNNLPAIRPSLLLDFANPRAVDPRITFTRSSTATRVNKFGLIESVASGVPRIDFDPVTLACKGLLIEEARTNLLTYSEQFDNVAWTKTRATVTANATTSPDGTTTADKLIETTDSLTHSIDVVVALISGTRYTASIYAKAGERTELILGAGASVLGAGNFSYGRFNLQTGVASTFLGDPSASMVAVGNGWYRCTMSFTSAVTGTCSASSPQLINSSGTNTYTGDGTSGIYIWGAQLEAGAFPTSYIPTSTAATTRTADVAVMTGANFSEWYRQDEGTFVVTASVSAIDMAGIQEHYLVTASDGSSDNYIALRGFSGTGVNAGALRVDALVRASGVAQADTTEVILLPGSVFTAAVAFKTNDVASSVNASTPSTDSSVVIPTVSTLYVGGYPSGWAKSGTIRRIAFFPKRLANAELQAITA